MFEELRRSEQKFRNNEYSFFQIVAVYAQPVDDDVERHKIKFCETMGVKGHVRRAWTDFLLIPTPAGKKRSATSLVTSARIQTTFHTQHAPAVKSLMSAQTLRAIQGYAGGVTTISLTF